MLSITAACSHRLGPVSLCLRLHDSLLLSSLLLRLLLPLQHRWHQLEEAQGIAPIRSASVDPVAGLPVIAQVIDASVDRCGISRRQPCRYLHQPREALGEDLVTNQASPSD